jgi:hypothetical protein
MNSPRHDVVLRSYFKVANHQHTHSTEKPIYNNVSLNLDTAWSVRAFGVSKQYQDAMVERWKAPALRKLNFGIVMMFSSAAAIGFDVSLINDLLAIPASKPTIVLIL